MKKKITLGLPKETEDHLNNMKRACRIIDDSEIFENALTILDWAIEKIQKGEAVASINHEKGTYSELDMDIFDDIKK